MPELPDVLLYVHAMDRCIVGRTLERIQVRSPFVLRTVEPDLFSLEGQVIRAIRRVGKRIVWEFDRQQFLVFHLMIAGRFHWRKAGAKPAGKIDLAAFHFADGVLMLTEASPKKRAALYVIDGETNLAALDAGGIDVLTCDEPTFAAALRSENHTLKRALTDPRLFSGIGNAYSDEILHAARMSPVKLTQRLTDDDVAQLYTATRTTLQAWTNRLIAEAGDDFPERVTAFREGMAVHGRYRQPCPVCGTKVQRIVRAENESNYCAKCQTGGKLLADRSLSRLLKDDWPKMVDDL